MIRTDGNPTIATPTPAEPYRPSPRVKPECTPGTAAFYARYGGPCAVCCVARDYHVKYVENADRLTVGSHPFVARVTYAGPIAAAPGAVPFGVNGAARS